MFLASLFRVWILHGFFIDFDNIEIGVKSTLNSTLDLSLVLDALKERGEVVASPDVNPPEAETQPDDVVTQRLSSR